MDIANIVGKDNFEKLKRHFGGNLIWIPKPGNAGTKDPGYFDKRDRLIKYFREKGLGIKELAKKFNLSEKRIYNIINSRGNCGSLQ